MENDAQAEGASGRIVIMQFEQVAAKKKRFSNRENVKTKKVFDILLAKNEGPIDFGLHDALRNFG